MPGKRSKPSTRLKYVREVKSGSGEAYLYYRRGGRQIPLPRPEGSIAFLLAYKEAENSFKKEEPNPVGVMVRDAITLYLSSANFLSLSKRSQAEYRRVLDRFREEFGDLAMTSLNEAWIENLRDKYSRHGVAWNALRARMIEVTTRFRKAHPNLLPANFWKLAKRIRVKAGNPHRPWPLDVLQKVLTASTPNFRALLIAYLITAQRGSDVTKLLHRQYDAKARTLTLTQQKSDEPLVLHVPEVLATAIASQRVRHHIYLLSTPRGKQWTISNAEETLRGIRARLKTDYYTLHGLRATGPTALKMLGFENRAIRSLTGHTSDANLELYLRGADHYVLAKAGQEAIQSVFADVIKESLKDGNKRSASGATGRKKKV